MQHFRCVSTLNVSYQLNKFNNWSPFAVIAFTEFLSYKLYTVYDKESVATKCSTERLFWKISCKAEASLSSYYHCIVSHAWLIQDSWILFFNVFFNLAFLKLCLWCVGEYSAVVVSCFWPSFVTFLVLIPCKIMKNYFCPK